jgi:hypothetical protein
MRDRYQRAADGVRAEAYRLALEHRCASAAEIESRLVEDGMEGVSEALEPIRSILDIACRAAKKPVRHGVIGMLDNGQES